MRFAQLSHVNLLVVISIGSMWSVMFSTGCINVSVVLFDDDGGLMNICFIGTCKVTLCNGSCSFVCVCVCVCARTCVCVCVCLCACMSMCVCVYTCPLVSWHVSGLVINPQSNPFLCNNRAASWWPELKMLRRFNMWTSQGSWSFNPNNTVGCTN